MLHKAHALDKGPMECKTAADLRRCQQAALKDVLIKPTYGPLWLVPIIDRSRAPYATVISRNHVRDYEHYEERPHEGQRMTNFDYEGGWELARCITHTILITDIAYDRNTIIIARFFRRVLMRRISRGFWSRKMHDALNDHDPYPPASAHADLNFWNVTK